MKNKKVFRSFTVLLAALIIMGGFSVTAYAGGGEEYEYTEPEETTGGYEPQPLTPEGNMSLVDDISGEASGDKQFITVVSRNGHYFYIIIDRAEDGENTVHFLNQVDEADLLQLMEDEQTEETAAVCSCTDKCVAGSVNTSCPVCSVNMSECAGKEAAPADPEPTDEPEEKGSGGMGGIILVVLLLAGGGGAFFYFKVMKPKKNTAKGGTNFDDLDLDEDEETEEEEPLDRYIDGYGEEAEPEDEEL